MLEYIHLCVFPVGAHLVEAPTCIYHGHSAGAMCDVKCTWNSRDDPRCSWSLLVLRRPRGSVISRSLVSITQSGSSELKMEFPETDCFPDRRGMVLVEKALSDGLWGYSVWLHWGLAGVRVIWGCWAADFATVLLAVLISAKQSCTLWPKWWGFTFSPRVMLAEDWVTAPCRDRDLDFMSYSSPHYTEVAQTMEPTLPYPHPPFVPILRRTDSLYSVLFCKADVRLWPVPHWTQCTWEEG